MTGEAAIVALILACLAGVLTAVSWITPLDTRIPLLLVAIAAAFLALDAGGAVD